MGGTIGFLSYTPSSDPIASGHHLPRAGDGTRVSREAVLAPLPEAVRRRLTLYADLLVRWQATINLVSPKTLPDLWTRHIGDSLQAQAAAPNARRWVDLGSGGGFPGLVTAILLADEPDASVHLVESDKRKAAFLRTVARETGVAGHDPRRAHRGFRASTRRAGRCRLGPRAGAAAATRGLRTAISRGRRRGGVSARGKRRGRIDRLRPRP